MDNLGRLETSQFARIELILNAIIENLGQSGIERLGGYSLQDV